MKVIDSGTNQNKDKPLTQNSLKSFADNKSKNFAQQANEIDKNSGASTTSQNLDKVNFALAVFVVLIPVLISVAGIFGIDATVDIFVALFGVIYLIFLAIKFWLKIAKNELSKEDFKKFFSRPIVICFCAFALIVLVSTIINGIGVGILFYTGFLSIIICFASLKKEKLKPMFFAWLIILNVCIIMGYVDIDNAFMPGFYPGSYSLSIQFSNPNYSAEIVATSTVLCCFVFTKTDKKWLKSLLFLSFLNFAMFLLLNGSFMSITAVFLVLFISFFVFLKRDKKTSLDMLLFFLIFATLSFVVDAIPFLYENRSTTKANYFIEVIGAFDSLFGTDVMGTLGITNWHGIDISLIRGFDGWDRRELWQNAIEKISQSPIFGFGAGSYEALRPHNVLLSLAIDFGFFGSLSYVAIVVCLFTQFFKTKRKTFVQYVLLMAIVINIFDGLLGSLMPASHYLSMVVVGLFLNSKTQDETNKPLFKTNIKIDQSSIQNTVPKISSAEKFSPKKPKKIINSISKTKPKPKMVKKQYKKQSQVKKRIQKQ
jgi:O-antigen ligase